VPRLPDAELDLRYEGTVNLVLDRRHQAETILTYNKATPPEILQRLAQDPDEILARNARKALERRTRPEAAPAPRKDEGRRMKDDLKSSSAVTR